MIARNTWSPSRWLVTDFSRNVGHPLREAYCIPRDVWPIVRRKLDQIDSVIKLEDLRIPPGNRLHALVGDLTGRHSLRVNDQYRIVFRFEGQDAHDVRCTDYH